MHFRIIATVFLALAATCASTASFAATEKAATAPGYPNTRYFGNPVNPQARWYRACMRVQNAAPPASDLPAAGAQPGPCDAQLLYYDTLDNANAVAADWARVRACAFATHEQAVLMMLYANGLGVAANRDLALKYACSLGGAPLEMRGRTETLSHPADRAARPEAGDAPPGEHNAPFDQCDDAASRLTINTCAAIAQRRDAHAAQLRLDTLTAGWPARDRAALARLQTALQAFADARSRYEADLMGTLGPLYAPAAENVRAAETAQFLDDLTRYEKGWLPKYTPEQHAGFTSQLDQAYRKVLADDPQDAAGVQATEEAWARYRDAWVAFGAVRYPAVPAQAWEARLSARRIQQLRKLHREGMGRK
jgi:hypothetical protein